MVAGWVFGLIGWVTGYAFNLDGHERGIPTGLTASVNQYEHGDNINLGDG